MRSHIRGVQLLQRVAHAPGGGWCAGAHGARVYARCVRGGGGGTRLVKDPPQENKETTKLQRSPELLQGHAAPRWTPGTLSRTLPGTSPRTKGRPRSPTTFAWSSNIEEDRQQEIEVTRQDSPGYSLELEKAKIKKKAFIRQKSRNA